MLDLELVFVGDVLILASAALGVFWTNRVRSQRRGLDDLNQCSPCKLAMDLNDFSLNDLTGYDKGTTSVVN